MDLLQQGEHDREPGIARRRKGRVLSQIKGQREKGLSRSKSWNNTTETKVVCAEERQKKSFSFFFSGEGCAAGGHELGWAGINGGL